MREQLDAIVSELRRLRREGVGRVSVSESSLATLRSLAGSAKKESPAPVPAVVRPVEKTPEKPDAPPTGAPEIAVRESVPESEPAAAAPAEKPFPAPREIRLKAGDAAGGLAELGSLLLADPVAKAGAGDLAPIVFDGAPDAPVIFLIHMPGRDDAFEGRLLSGAEGELYGKIVAAMGLPREKVMTASILPYRPSGDREPMPGETAYFLPYFRELAATVKPRAIVALGGGAAEALLGKSGPISKTRGVWGAWDGVPVMPTYHISYLIRNNTNKSKRIVWEDLLEVMALLRLPVGEKQRGYFLR